MAPTSCFNGQVHRLPDSPEAYGAMITRAKAAPAQSRLRRPHGHAQLSRDPGEFRPPANLTKQMIAIAQRLSKFGILALTYPREWALNNPEASSEWVRNYLQNASKNRP